MKPHEPEANIEPKTAHQRLCEWGIQRKQMPWEAWPEATVLQRIREEGPNAGHRTDTQSDGGVGAMVDRMAKVVAKASRCRDVRMLVERLERSARDHERQHYAIIEATYMGPWVPRSERGAAEHMHIARNTYRKRRDAMLAYVTYHLDLRESAAPAEAPSCECTEHVVCRACLREWMRDRIAPLATNLYEAVKQWPQVLRLKRGT